MNTLNSKTMNRIKTTVTCCLIGLITAGAAVSAQEMRVITLQHGETTTVFYGDKFSDAHTAAVDGDLITLSSGEFTVTQITKAVKIQGAGYTQTPASNRYRTTLTNSSIAISVALPTTSSGLLIEGVYTAATITFTGAIKDCVIKKSYVAYLNFSGTQNNCGVDQCRIGRLYFVSPENCYAKNTVFYYTNYSTSSGISYLTADLAALRTGASTSKTVIENCVFPSFDCASVLFRNNIFIRINATNSNPLYRHVFTDTNSISENTAVVSSAGTTALPTGSVATGTMLVTPINMYGVSTIPNAYAGYLQQLSPVAQDTYKGTDGKQVGIYGGSNPHTDVPTNPQVTAKSIATSSGSDGKLKVEITVQAQ